MFVAVNKTLEYFGFNPLRYDVMPKLVGEGAQVMLDRAFNECGLLKTANIIDEALEIYLDAYRDSPATLTVIYDGVVEILNAYTEAGIPMGVCTNKPGEMTNIVLEALNLSRFFKAYTAGDSVPHRKPDGRHILLTLELMNAEHLRAVVVGDSKTDVEAAKSAGLPCIGVSFGYAKNADELAAADKVINRFSALPLAISGVLDN